MALLHYGSELRIRLDVATTQQVMEALALTRAEVGGLPRPIPKGGTDPSW
jgi:hypothetical protein